MIQSLELENNQNKQLIQPLGTFVRNQVKKVLDNQKSAMLGSMIDEIHPEINIRYNSVNVIVGKQSLGKTVIALEEIIKIALMNTHHMLIYITKNGDENDKSFQALRRLLLIPVITISESQAIEFIQTIIDYKNLYYQIKREHLENDIIDEQRDEIYEYLSINDFDKEYLHTLVLFDDISNNKLFANEEGFFPQQIKRCRHTNISYFLLIQGWKGIKPFVKNEITTLLIFPCYNRQQLRFIYSQSSSNLDFDEFDLLYSEMKKYKNKNKDSHPYMVIQVIEGGDTKVEV